MRRNIIFIFLISLITILSLSYVNAYLLYCLNNGEQLPPDCSGNECKYTCRHTQCQVCTTDNGYPGVNPHKCDSLTCNTLGGNNPDLDPPELTLLSPINGETYPSKRVYINLQADPSAKVEIKDNLNRRGWRTITNYPVSSYNKARSFKEGINDVTIRVRKSNGLTDEERVVFYVDSKNPKIRKIYPGNKEFLSGEFTVEYTELNLQKVEFYYKGITEINWNVVNVPNCSPGNKQTCSVNVDLGPYEGQEVEYKFRVYDKAISSESRTQRGRVDTVAPVLTINNFFASGYSNKKVLFDLSSTEEVDFFYVDNNDPRERRRKLCSGPTCKKQVNFKDGQWDITIFAEDEAGNFDYEQVTFFIDTKKPRIHKQIPSRGWANGLFTIEYTETRLFDVSLFYGINGNYDSVHLTNCQSGKKQTCSIEVDLSQFDGGKVDTYFTVTDNYHSVSSKLKTLNVDITPPEFTQVNFQVDGNKVGFDLKTSEAVDVEYMDSADSRQRFRGLCRNKEYCKKTKRFKPGAHVLTLRAVDEAGNSQIIDINFNILSR